MTTVAPPREAVVFDLEGGLINVSRIRHLAKDASAFHRASLNCPPNRRVLNAARQAHEKGKVVLVMTGGDQRLKRHVAAWLAQHDVPSTMVLMRCRGDYRPGAVVKRERLRAAHRQFADLSVWSADPNVTRLSEQEGIGVKPLPGYWGDLS
ncbi:phosphatase domain-containing protein [Streptomyces sp. 900116325]